MEQPVCVLQLKCTLTGSIQFGVCIQEVFGIYYRAEQNLQICYGGNHPPANSVYPILHPWVFYSFSSPASQEFPFWSLKQKSNPHTILAAWHEKVTLQSFCLNWLRGGNQERCCVWIGNKSNVTICWQSFVPTSTIPETGNIDWLNLNTVDQVLHLHTRCKSNEPINLKLICVGMWDIVGVLGNGFQLFSTADWKRQGLPSIHV